MNTPAADVQGTAALLHICCNLPLRTLYIRGSKYALMAGMGNNTHRATKRRIYSIWLRSRPTALTVLTIIEMLSHQIGLSLSLSLSLYVFSVSLCLSLSPPLSVSLSLSRSLSLFLPPPPPPSLYSLSLSPSLSRWPIPFSSVVLATDGSEDPRVSEDERSSRGTQRLCC